MDLLLHSVLHALEHCGTSSENDALEEILLDVIVALHDGVKGELMDSVNVFVLGVSGLEEELWAFDSLRRQRHSLSCREAIRLQIGLCLFLSCLHLSIKILGNFAMVLLDVSDLLSLAS